MKKKDSQKIAAERIERLFELARQSLEKRPELAKRYIGLAKRIGMRYNIRLPSPLKRSFCKKCNILLVPGKTAKVRVARGQKTVTCLSCGALKRYPYRKRPAKAAR